MGLLAAVRRHALLVVATTLLCAAAGYMLARSLPKEYSATATVTVARPDTLPVYRTVSAGDASNRQLTIANQMRDTRTLARAASALGVSAATLSGAVVVTPQAQTALIDVAATASNPETAARRANAVIAAFRLVAAEDQAQQTAASVAPLQVTANGLAADVARLGQQVQARGTSIRAKVADQYAGRSTTDAGSQDRALQAALQSDATYAGLRTQLAASQSALGALQDKMRQLRVDGLLMGDVLASIDAAAAPTSPDSLPPRTAALLGALVGLLLGCGLAWWRAERRMPLSATRAAAVLDVPVLLELAVPRRALSSQERLSAMSVPGPLLDTLAVALAQSVRGHGVRRLVVAPATQEPDAPAVSAALAAALLRAGEEVVLVDAGDGGGRLTDLTGRSGRPGLADVGAGRALALEVVGVLDLGGLRVPFVPVGTGGLGPVGGAAALTALEPVASTAVMVVDAPGLAGAGTALVATGELGELVLVTAGTSAVDGLTRARTNLDLAGTTIVGIVHVRPVRGARRADVRRARAHVATATPPVGKLVVARPAGGRLQ